MITIWKYSLQSERTGTNVIKMREGAHVISVQIQHGDVCLWAIVDTDKPDEERKFYIVFTGQEIPGEAFNNFELVFCGTVQMEGIVIHVFEEEIHSERKS